MTADHETRRERLAAELAEDRLAAVVVAPSPDLVYLTGYGPMPLERLTALVIRPDGAAVLVVPELERQLALDSAAGQTLETNQVVGWRDGDDPYDLVSSILPREGRVAIGDRMWASHVLALQRTAPGPRVRARLADHRPSPRREGPRRARARCGAPAGAPTRRSARSAACGSSAGVRRRSRRTWRALLAGARALPRRLHDRGLGPERRVAAPRAEREDDLPQGRRRDGFRRRGGRVLLRHHAHRGGGGAAGGVRGGVPVGAGGAGRRRADRPPGRHRPGRRPGRADGSSTRRATASGSSTGPATGSGSRSTSRPTSSRATRRC